jgi:uncharacterized protein DUF3467
LNTATIGKPVKVNHQVVMNYFTAKRLAMALQVSVARHEKAFGPIETDINKRLRGAPEAK